LIQLELVPTNYPHEKEYFVQKSHSQMHVERVGWRKLVVEMVVEQPFVVKMDSSSSSLLPVVGLQLGLIVEVEQLVVVGYLIQIVG
jgi:hypothetical protein